MSIAEPPVETKSVPEARHLGGPVTDFVMLGGGSLLLFPILFVLPNDSLNASVVKFAFYFAFLVNHPHFAVSYRLFYDGFAGKVAGVGQNDPNLRYRYMFAGIVAPLLLGAGLLAVALAQSSTLLVIGYNLMGFFVGWHYVKQGYGMAMVDAALKRRFLPAFDKKVLLLNGYAVWGFSWASLNSSADSFDFWGLAVRRAVVPSQITWAFGAVMAATTAVLAYRLGVRALNRMPTAWVGIVAYLVTLYVWLILVRANPLMLLITPALHSLQYLWVVRRYQINRHEADETARSWGSQYRRSILLGAAMFILVPVLLNTFAPLNVDVWGTLPFLVVFAIFINIHHYFLDNVMWRRGNPDVTEHLFA